MTDCKAVTVVSADFEEKPSRRSGNAPATTPV